MNDYGLRTKDAIGNILTTITDKLNRHRYNNEVAAGASNNTTLSDISGENTIGLSIMINPPTGNTAVASAYCPHEITRSETTITWVAASGLYHVSNDSLLLIFIYV